MKYEEFLKNKRFVLESSGFDIEKSDLNQMMYELDNLKLGYGGTKTEMERLLADAEELSGIKYDIDNLNDVYSAIHVIQTEIGITGTTAKEASATISGSVSAMKSAWSNLITGIADENQNLDVLVNNFVDSAATTAENLLPRIKIVLKGASSLIKELLPVIIDEIPIIISDILPDLLHTGVDMVGSLAQGFADNLPILAETAAQIVDVILYGIGDICPAFGPITDVIQLLIDNLDTVLAVLIPLIAAFTAWKAVLAISSLIDGVKKALDGMTIAQYAAKVAQDLLNASMLANPITLIIMAIAALVAAFIYLWNTNEDFRQFWIDVWENISSFFIDIWNNIISFFTETIPNLISNIGTWFSELPENIAYWLGYVVTKAILWAAEMKAKAREAAKNFIDTAISFFKQLPEKVGTWFLNTISKVLQFRQDLINKAKEIGRKFVDGLIDFVKDLPNKFTQIGSNIITGIWNGISAGWDWLKGKVKDVANSLFQGAKDALDIHSPSRRFKWIGEMCIAGMDEPLEEYNPYDTLKNSMQANIGGLQVAFANTATGTARGFTADYSLIGQEVKNAIQGLGVYMDGEHVGHLIAPTVNNDFVIYNNRRT